MSDHQTWQRETALRRIAAEQDRPHPHPLRLSIAAAARYVGAEESVVERWWNGRGR